MYEYNKYYDHVNRGWAAMLDDMNSDTVWIASRCGPSSDGRWSYRDRVESGGYTRRYFFCDSEDYVAFVMVRGR